MKYLIHILLQAVFLSFCFGQTPHDTGAVGDPECTNLIGGPTIKDVKVVGTDFLPSPPSSGPPEDAIGDRYVYFAHGYGGNETSWLRGETELTARSLIDLLRIKRVYNQGYPSLQGLDAGASNWSQILVGADICRADGVEPIENIVIGHSFGGLVGRYAFNHLASDPNRPSEDLLYNGLITFDTPHLGAGFASNLNLVDEFIEDACNELTIGPALDAATQIKVVSWFANTPETVEDVTTSFCGGVVAPFANVLLQFFGINADPDPGSPSTARDLQEGSAALQALNSTATIDPGHHIVISSNEDQDGLVWRTLYWAAVDNTNNYNFGKANCDGPLVPETDDCPSGMDDFNTIGEWISWYRDNRIRLINEANDITCFLRLSSCVNRRQAIRAAGRAFGRGERWLQRADDEFKALAGFTQVTTTNTGPSYCECLASDVYGQSTPTWFRISGSNCTVSACQTQLPAGANISGARTSGGTVVTVNNLENDGIVSRQSQEGWGTIKWRYDESNHFQVRNDKTTEDAFERALLRGDGDRWFKCER